MGQKVNPHGLRVGVIKGWDSRWFAKDELVGDLIVEDYKIREYLKNSLQQAGIPKIEIERDSAKVRVFIHCARPGMIVGKAIRMADMMNIPVLALVENMSYLNCPDCGRPIEVFGKSKVDAVAKEYNIAHTAKLPIDPTLAGLVDAGLIERYETDALDNVLATICALPKKD